MIRTKFSEIVAERGRTNKSQLTREMGMNRWTVIHLLENDTPERMDLLTIEKICKTLNVMPNDLFEITNDDGTLWSPIKDKNPKDKVSREKKDAPPSENG